MKFSKAVEGFFTVRGVDLSDTTVTMYTWALGLMGNYLGNPEVEAVTEKDLLNFFNYLKRDYVPTRKTGDTKPLKPRSIENVWTAMRSFWNWATPELKLKSRPDNSIPRPKYKPEPIHPFTDDELVRLLKACEYTKVCHPGDRKAFAMRRPTAQRDTAIISVLLDTGVRVSECARLNVGDLNLQSGELRIQSWGTGRKTKAHTVIVGKAARKALWKYLAQRDEPQNHEPLFVTINGGRLDRNSIRQLVNELGVRAGVPNCHPHRFRHTMAVMFLRNHGDVFTLQKILGHETLEMVKVYLELSGSDIAAAHRRASPLDGLHR